MDRRYHPDTIKALTKRNALPPTFDQGQKMADDLSAENYVECSAKTGEGVEDVFKAAIAVGLEQIQLQKKKEEQRQRWEEEYEERRNAGFRGKLRNLFS